MERKFEPENLEPYIRLKDCILGLETTDPKFYTITPDVLMGMTEILKTLNIREETLLRYRFGLGEYREAHNLEESGAFIGVTRERARQIEAKAISKLRNPARSRKLKTGWIEKEAAIKSAPISDDKAAETFIEELDFSIRTHNILRRAGINTILDILNIEGSKIFKIRNLGTLCLKEIIQKLNEIGYKEKADEFAALLN